jgi:phage major head subunit gpT-like protein
MLVTTQNVREMDRGMSKAFENGRGRAQPWYTKVATVVPSSHESQVFPFGARVGKMREWKGPRIAKQLSNYEYVLVNKTFESTIEVPVNAFEDDTLGVHLSPMSELGHGAAKWPDYQVKDRMQNGKSGTASLGFDGQPFFSTTHDLNPEGDQSNLFTTLPLNAANLETVVIAMRQFKDEVGEVMGAGRLTLVIPPNLELTAKSIVGAALIADSGAGVTNVMQNYVDIMVLDELENEPTTWYVADFTKGLKPFLFQQRMAPKMTSRTGLESDNVFERDMFEWGTKARGVAGYGPWWLCSRCEAT